MKVDAIKIYDIEESIVASGFPMLDHYDEEKFLEEVGRVRGEFPSSNGHFSRAFKLASAQDGSGHKNFLAGISVSMNITASQVWWIQWQRYSFQKIVSSMSKMHRLGKMLKNDSGDFSIFHDKTTGSSINALDSMNGVTDEETLVYNCPMGLMLTARVNTNYLQLRTMYRQRRNHKLKEWRDFCKVVESFPYAGEFITLQAGKTSKESEYASQN